MLFDFDIFARVTLSAYREVGNSPYSFEEVLGVFKYFFDTYEYMMGCSHPPIKRAQVIRIIEAMPFYDRRVPCVEYENEGYGEEWEYVAVYREDIAPEDYPILINAYFNTWFPMCNYRINHFFSGDIRALRMYEELY